LDELSLVAVRSTDPNRYRSYLVRLWREVPGASWRCQVQCVGTGQKRCFAGLAELFEFLVADAALAFGDAHGTAESPDAAWEGQRTDSPPPEMPGS
jgi:hypothetical protein